MHSHAGKTVRKTHYANDGKRYNVAEGWFDPDPKVSRRIWPGELINCFPGETLVDLVNGCHVIWRYYYRGDMISLETGKTIVRATPNHPFLTSKGWVAAEAINEGDYVWKARRKEVDAGMAHIDQTKFRLADVFAALSRLSPVGITSGLANAVFNFHGDIPYTEVETVRAEFGLLSEGYLCSKHGVSELDFAAADRQAIRVGPAFMEVTHPRFAGGLRDFAKIGVTGIGKPNITGLTATSRRDVRAPQRSNDAAAANLEMSGNGEDAVSFVKHPDNVGVCKIAEILAWRNATPAHDAKYDGGAYTEMPRNLRDGVSLAMKGNNRVEVDMNASSSNSDFPLSVGNDVAITTEGLAQFVRRAANIGSKVFHAGKFVYEAVRVSKKFRSVETGCHVYTLQSNDGWYGVAQNGLVSKNCRCVSKPIVKGFS